MLVIFVFDSRTQDLQVIYIEDVLYSFYSLTQKTFTLDRLIIDSMAIVTLETIFDTHTSHQTNQINGLFSTYLTELDKTKVTSAERIALIKLPEHLAEKVSAFLLKYI